MSDVGEEMSPVGLVAIASAGAAEIGLAGGYVMRGAALHGLIECFVGGAVGLLVASTVLLARGQPVRRPWHVAFAVIVTGHALAAVPDVLFVLGTPHENWMNLFLGHVSAVDFPGGSWGLLVVFLAALAAYLGAAVADIA